MATEYVTECVTECVVCCEAYNKTTRQRIPCEHSGACEFEACKACVRKYLLGTTNDPNCMQCNKAWSDKFLTQHLKATFMRNDYKIHRKELLAQQQLSRLPETMAAAERAKGEEVLFGILVQLRKEESMAIKKFKEVSASKMEKEAKKIEMEKARETFNLIHANVNEAQYNLNVHREGGMVAGEAVEKKEEARKFIMPCGNTDCRGYLSTKYKCELCDHHTCAKCFEHLGPVKEAAEPHVCNPENIESAEFIRKQSKPCPCCGTRISKIDGCDQMWCTQCHKAFSWNTGKLVTGVIHNPHFYQYQREHGGAPRNPGDVVCGGMPTINEIKRKIDTAALPKVEQDFFYKVYERYGDLVGRYITQLRWDIPRYQDYEPDRIRYILKKITREELADTVFAKDTKRKKQTAILHVCELFTTVCAEMFRRILLSEKTGHDFATELKQFTLEFNALRQYVNEQLKEISMTYGICILQIQPDWSHDTSKFNAKGETDTYIKGREKLRETRRIEEQERSLAAKAEKKERLAKYNAAIAAAAEQDEQAV